jgi:hypothetical protein
VGDGEALTLVERLRAIQPTEADAILARLRLRQAKLDEATQALVSAFIRYRRDPWPWETIMRQAIYTAGEIAHRNPASIPALRAALDVPFAISMLDDMRSDAILTLARSQGIDRSCANVLAAFEPHVPWQLAVLSWRARCYEMIGHPAATRASADLDEYLSNRQTPFGVGLVETDER